MLRARVFQKLDRNSVLVLSAFTRLILVILIVIVTIIIIIIIVMVMAIALAEYFVDLSIGQGYHVEISVRAGLNIGADTESGAEEQ